MAKNCTFRNEAVTLKKIQKSKLKTPMIIEVLDT